jgi:hypothetical protein
MISRFYVATFLVPHGDMRTGDVASPEPSVFKGFQAFDICLLIAGSWIIFLNSYLLTF